MVTDIDPLSPSAAVVRRRRRALAALRRGDALALPRGGARARELARRAAAGRRWTRWGSTRPRWPRSARSAAASASRDDGPADERVRGSGDTANQPGWFVRPDGYDASRVHPRCGPHPARLVRRRWHLRRRWVSRPGSTEALHCSACGTTSAVPTTGATTIMARRVPERSSRSACTKMSSRCLRDRALCDHASLREASRTGSGRRRSALRYVRSAQGRIGSLERTRTDAARSTCFARSRTPTRSTAYGSVTSIQLRVAGLRCFRAPGTPRELQRFGAGTYRQGDEQRASARTNGARPRGAWTRGHHVSYRRSRMRSLANAGK